MRNYGAVTLVVGLLFGGIVSSATAQEAEDLARIYFVDPKPGMAGQLEEALKTHLEWRKQHNDSWTWATFHVVNGDNFGQYGIRSGGHTWADLDAYEMTTAGGPEGANHFTTTVGPIS